MRKVEFLGFLYNIPQTSQAGAGLVVGIIAVLVAVALGILALLNDKKDEKGNGSGWRKIYKVPLLVVTCVVIVAVVCLVVIWLFIENDPNQEGVDRENPDPVIDTSDESAPEGFPVEASETPEQEWELAWEDQPFSFAPSFGEDRLIDFDTPDYPETWLAQGNDYRRTNENNPTPEVEFPADLAYVNAYWGRLRLQEGRSVGESTSERPTREECRQHAVSGDLGLNNLEFRNDPNTTLPLQEGDALCLLTDQQNVVWIKIIEYFNPNGPRDTVGGHTIKGEATLWRRVA